MQFEVEWDPKWYENKVETIEGIHSLNLFDENNLEGAKKNHPIKTICRYMEHVLDC